MFNRATLIGRLGRDPESRTGPSGQLKVSLSVATDERYKDRQGVMQEKTEWHNVVAWDKTAEVIMKYLHKGSQVFIEGPIRTDVWEGTNSEKRTRTYVLVHNIKFLGEKGHAKSAPAEKAPAASDTDNEEAPF
jgi:single-strand DNA-binding protein